MNKKVREDLINNLIQTEFISLNKEDLSKYNCEDILQESLKTIKTLKNELTKETPEDSTPKGEIKIMEKIGRKSYWFNELKRHSKKIFRKSDRFC